MVKARALALAIDRNWSWTCRMAELQFQLASLSSTHTHSLSPACSPSACNESSKPRMWPRCGRISLRPWELRSAAGFERKKLACVRGRARETLVCHQARATQCNGAAPLVPRRCKVADGAFSPRDASGQEAVPDQQHWLGARLPPVRSCAHPLSRAPVRVICPSYKHTTAKLARCLSTSAVLTASAAARFTTVPHGPA